MKALEHSAQEQHQVILAEKSTDLEQQAQRRHDLIVLEHAEMSRQEQQQWAATNEALASDRQHMLQTAEALQHERNIASDAARQALAENDRLMAEMRQRDALLRMFREREVQRLQVIRLYQLFHFSRSNVRHSLQLRFHQLPLSPCRVLHL